ncbi:putative multidomain presynaptic cytomatrix related protein [Zalerion maritima]|uniref:Autophagy-related protein 29 n=1 Tax=Zalerion maritima TaxID=339359 RepID=A0AAD5WXI7_9PEZI|nr:putative multidomain presynaptic cytomatrix related protein [Zalerion maritima]
MERLSDSSIEPTYTVFIRVPFPRGNFVDPPPVHWDTNKDDELWNILLSQKMTDIDWNDLYAIHSPPMHLARPVAPSLTQQFQHRASRFQVTVEFLAQQVKYLNERHNTRLKDILKGVPKGNSGTSSPVPGTEAGGEAMKRTASGGGGAPRVPSGLSIRRDSPLPKNEPVTSKPPSTTPSVAAGGGRPTISRNATLTTTTAVLAQQGGAASPRLKKATIHRNTSPRRRLSSLGTIVPSSTPGPADARPSSPTPSTPASNTSSPTSSSASSPAQSRIIRRPPRFKPSQPQQHDGTSSFADDDLDDGDESETPAFMPQQTGGNYGASSGRARTPGHDLGATLRGDPRRQTTVNSQTSDSSASSTAVVGRDGREVGNTGVSGAGPSRIPGPLSPRRAADLSGKGKGKGHHGYSSDGTPSMGSSFSDLDGEFVLAHHPSSRAQ